MLEAALVLVAATGLVAAGGTGPGAHVEHVDATDYPDVRLVVSAPQGEVTDPRDAFRVLEDGAALPIRGAAVDQDAVEVVLLAGTPEGPDATAPRVRSAVMDLMLRMPRGANVALIDAGDPAGVVTELGSPLQDRIAAASRLAARGQPALRDALILALRQFSYTEGTVRSVVLVGAGDRDAIPDALARRLAARQVTVHAVSPDASGAAAGTGGLVDRLSSLYRLAFRVRTADRTEVRIVADGGSTPTTVALAASPEGRTPEASTAPVDAGGDRGGLQEEGSGWPAFPFALVALTVVLLLSAGIALPSAGAGARDPRPAESWERAAAEVTRETGTHDTAPADAAGRIAQERQRAASEMRAAGLVARLAAAVLGVQPAVAGALILLFARGRSEDLDPGAWHVAGVLAALALTVAGAVWLRRVARPPFSAAPARWRAYEREAAAARDIADTLDRAALHAAGGLPLDEALTRAGASDPGHPARRHLEALGTPDASATEALSGAASGIRAGRVSAAQRQAERAPVALAVPFLACTLPAMILLAVTGWSALGAG